MNPQPSVRADTLIVFGARCVWWDSIDKAGSIPRPNSPFGGLPCCPHCKSVLLQMDESQWWSGVERYEREQPEPGYRQMIEWQRGKCFPSVDHVRAAYAVREAICQTIWPACLHHEIIEAAWAHPVWSHYALSIVHLRDTDGAPPATKHFPEATHELVIAALDPKDNKTPPFPANYCGQFAFAEDHQAAAFARAVAMGVRSSAIHPDTDFLRRFTAPEIERMAKLMGATVARTSWAGAAP